MPEINAISCGGRPMAASARVRAVTTPKSPQPGHQMGLRSLLKSPAWNLATGRGSRVVVMFDIIGKKLCELFNEVFKLLMVALDRNGHFPQPLEDLCWLNRVGAALGQRLDHGGDIHIHPHQTVKLSLERLLDEQAAAHV